MKRDSALKGDASDSSLSGSTPQPSSSSWRPSLPTRFKAYVGSALDTASGVPSWLAAKAGPAAAEGAGMLRSAANAVGARTRSSHQYNELLDEELLDSAHGPSASSGGGRPGGGPRLDRRSLRRERGAAAPEGKRAPEGRRSVRHSLGERGPREASGGSSWGPEEGAPSSSGASSVPAGALEQEPEEAEGAGAPPGGYASDPEGGGLRSPLSWRRGGEPSAALLGDHRSSPAGQARALSARALSTPKQPLRPQPPPSAFDDHPALIHFGDEDGMGGGSGSEPSSMAGPQGLGPGGGGAAPQGRRPQSAAARLPTWSPEPSSTASFQRFQETLAKLPGFGAHSGSEAGPQAGPRPHSSSPTKAHQRQLPPDSSAQAARAPGGGSFLGSAASLAGLQRRTPYNRLPLAQSGTDPPDLLLDQPGLPEPSSSAGASPAASSRSLGVSSAPAPSSAPFPGAAQQHSAAGHSAAQHSAAGPSPARLARPSRPPPAPPHGATSAVAQQAQHAQQGGSQAGQVGLPPERDASGARGPPGGPPRGVIARDSASTQVSMGSRTVSSRASARSLLDGPGGEEEEAEQRSEGARSAMAAPHALGSDWWDPPGDLLGPLWDTHAPAGSTSGSWPGGQRLGQGRGPGDPLGGDPADVFGPLGTHHLAAAARGGPRAEAGAGAGAGPASGRGIASAAAAPTAASREGDRNGRRGPQPPQRSRPRAASAPAEELPSPSYDIFEPRAPASEGGQPLENGGGANGFRPGTGGASSRGGSRDLEALQELTGAEVLARLAAGVQLRKKWVSRLSRPEGDAAPKPLRTLRCVLAGGTVLLRYNHQGVKGLVDKQEVTAAVQRVEDPGGNWRPRKCIRVHTSKGVLALEPLGAYAYSLLGLGLNIALVAARTRRQSYVLSRRAVDVPRDGMFVAE